MGYLGLFSTNIEYNDTTFLWTANKFNRPKVWTWATSTASKESALIGTFDWTVYNDSRECNPNFSYKTRLTLTGCSSEQFTCVDGSCIGMEERCNGKVDCADKSDEIECITAVILTSYNKAISPPPLEGEKKVRVGLSVALEAILLLDELQEIMYVKYGLIVKWSDPGLSFHNLKKDANQNILTENEQTDIWIPKITFKSTKATERSIMDKNSIVRVLANENFTFSRTDLTHYQNIHIFEGSNTQLEMSRFYETEFLCLYHMAWYPFDTQTCTLDFTLDATASAFVSLDVGELEYTGPVELLQYFVRNSSMTAHQTSSQRGVRVVVVLGRRLLSNVLTVYMPTILLNVMGHVTVYFKPFFFEAIITVNLTVMLVLTTM